MRTKHLLLAALLGLCTLPAAFSVAEAQGTAFTYQGQLSAGGAPANGDYDFTFALFNNSSTNAGQVGGTLTKFDVGVTNGLFTLNLDFGPVFAGNAAWLAVGVRSNGGAGFTALSPLQELTPTPYAMYAPSAGVAASAGAVAATNIIGVIPPAQLPAVAASNITGTLSLAQLPAAVLTNNEAGVTLSGALSSVTIGTNLSQAIYDVKSFGALGNGILYNTGVIGSNSTTLIVANAQFNSGDIGKVIDVDAVGATNGNGALITTILAVNSLTNITLASPSLCGQTNIPVIYGSDDTAAIQLAINTVCSNGLGGGVLLFPPGQYIAAGPLQDVNTNWLTHHNAQLFFPPVASNTPLSVTVTLEGTVAPNAKDSVFIGGTSLLPLGGFLAGGGATVWFLNPTTNWGRCIDVRYPGSGYVGGCSGNPGAGGALVGSVPFDFLEVDMRDMTFMTPENANRLVVDLSGCVGADVEHVNIETGYAEYFGQSNIWPYSAGLAMPSMFNAGKSIADYIAIGGYYADLMVNEHAEVDNAFLRNATFGFYFVCFGGHMAEITGGDAEGCYWPVGVNSNNNCDMSLIASITIENFPSCWTWNTGLIFDQRDLLGGSISYEFTSQRYTLMTNVGGVGVQVTWNELGTPPQIQTPFNVLGPINGTSENLAFNGATAPDGPWGLVVNQTNSAEEYLGLQLKAPNGNTWGFVYDTWGDGVLSLVCSTNNNVNSYHAFDFDPFFGTFNFHGNGMPSLLAAGEFMGSAAGLTNLPVTGSAVTTNANGSLTINLAGNGGGLTNIPVGAITGGLTTNIVINGLTFYYVNGSLVNIK